MTPTPQTRPLDGNRLPTRAKGARPAYFDDDGTTDALISIITALSGEVWALRERLDTVERLLAGGGQLSPDEVEGYRPSAAEAAARAAEARAFTGRVFRVFEEMREEVLAGETPEQYQALVRRAFDEI
jgi:hypothetical protein